MPIVLNGSGPVTGVTSLNTTVSDTEIGYLDGVTSALQTQVNGKANDSSQGLYLITSQTVSSQSSLTMDGIFTTTYQNYFMTYNISNISVAGSDVLLRYRWSGATTDGSVYSFSDEYLRLDASQNAFNGGSNASSHILGRSLQSTDPQLSGRCEIMNPRTAGTTGRQIIGEYVATQNGGSRYLYRNASLVNDGSKDGLLVYTSSGTFSGTIRVYGRKD